MTISTTPVMGNLEEIKVPMLTDEPQGSEYMKGVIQMSAWLIQAAKDDRLVSVVCGHDDSKKKSVILCAQFHDEDGAVSNYVPVAQLFDSDWADWHKLTPPKAAHMMSPDSE